jgi:uncharacterized protein YjaZ
MTKNDKQTTDALERKRARQFSVIDKIQQQTAKLKLTEEEIAQLIVEAIQEVRKEQVALVD